MENFTPVSALMGGALIGLAASIMLLFNGRIAGISGVFGGLLRPSPGDIGWRAAFIVGLVAAGLGFALVMPDAVTITADRGVGITAVAGIVVGFGVRMGNGCTSGHGVCGLSRFSRRSLVATVTFIFTGMVTATAIELMYGGVL